MSTPPARPKLYHITHMQNLESIIAENELICDATIVARGGPPSPIGMSTIKERRLRLPLECHAGDYVGDYVPFFFCPRSIMLYVIHCANHPDLRYRGGQQPILHLEADLHDAIDWANSANRRRAFSPSNAGAYYVQFHASLSELDEIDWNAVAANDFRDAVVKEKEQAEFLVRESFPWILVSRIGVYSTAIQSQVTRILQSATYRPQVVVRQDWYF